MSPHVCIIRPRMYDIYTMSGLKSCMDGSAECATRVHRTAAMAFQSNHNNIQAEPSIRHSGPWKTIGESTRDQSSLSLVRRIHCGKEVKKKLKFSSLARYILTHVMRLTRTIHETECITMLIYYEIKTREREKKHSHDIIILRHHGQSSSSSKAYPKLQTDQKPAQLATRTHGGKN